MLWVLKHLNTESQQQEQKHISKENITMDTLVRRVNLTIFFSVSKQFTPIPLPKEETDTGTKKVQPINNYKLAQLVETFRVCPREGGDRRRGREGGGMRDGDKRA